MNCLRRRKSEMVGELFVRRWVPGLGLIYEGLAETFFQHASPIKSPGAFQPYRDVTEVGERLEIVASRSQNRGL